LEFCDFCEFRGNFEMHSKGSHYMNVKSAMVARRRAYE
jgi:hypothetical protein